MKTLYVLMREAYRRDTETFFNAAPVRVYEVKEVAQAKAKRYNQSQNATAPIVWNYYVVPVEFLNWQDTQGEER